jgi:sulfur carrier protein
MVTESFQKAPGDSSAGRPARAGWASGGPARDNAGMDIRLNGDALALPAPCTLAELLVAQGLAERRVAVEVNGEIIPRGRHADHVIADGDVVEIVHALGGG